MIKNKKYFSKYVWLYLIYNFYVILGGAYVRATGSGAGCGNHWPLCKGLVVPNLSVIHTIIEFTHRVSSGVVAIGGVILLLWSYLCTSKNSPIRKSSWFVFVFIICEALLGAFLVKFGLVEHNSSNFRAVMMAAHLVVTFLLLASIALTGTWASENSNFKLNFKTKGMLPLGFALVALIIVGCSGAITALADTLFHPKFVGQGLVEDFQDKTHILKSMRVYHPILAIIISTLFVYLTKKYTTNNSSKKQILYSNIIFTLVVLQFVLGLSNIFLSTPIVIQILHLFVADLIWVFAILFTNELILQRS